jgi:hypothetical protein
MLPRLPIRWIDGCRTRRVAELIALLWVLSLADLFFTIWAQLFTPFQELNPLAARLLNQNHINLLIAGKIALTGLGAAIFWRLRKERGAELALWAVVLVYVLLTFRWSDYTNEIVAMGWVTM